MTRLSDYMRAEVPDETEPASFYVPGASDWREAWKGGRPKRPHGGAHEDQVTDETNDPLDTNDSDETIAAAKRAAAVLKLETE